MMLASCTPNQPLPITGSDPTSLPAQSLCTNPLFPVKVGSNWSYANSSGAYGTSTFTETVSDIRMDGFTLTTKFDELAHSQEWFCKPDGLLALPFGSAAPGNLSSLGINAEFTTSKASGVTLPVDVQPGKEWTYSLDIAGTITLQDGTLVPAHGTISTSMKAIGMESVSVPAGTFYAMKIEAVPTLNITANFQGLPLPVTFTGSLTLWFAPGVGWVKSTESGDLAGIFINSKIELKSFDIR